MQSFKCKDVGMSCKFEVKDENQEELMSMIAIRGQFVRHEDVLPEMMEKIKQAMKKYRAFPSWVSHSHSCLTRGPSVYSVKVKAIGHDHHAGPGMDLLHPGTRTNPIFSYILRATSIIVAVCSPTVNIPGSDTGEGIPP